MTISRTLFSKYAITAGGSYFSPIKAAVDVWRFTNASRPKTLRGAEGRLEELVSELWNEHFDSKDSRNWDKETAYTRDIAEPNLMINSVFAYHVYTVDVQLGTTETIARGFEKW
jgi:hypothetical protein